MDALLDTRTEVSASEVGNLLRVSQPRTAAIIQGLKRDGRIMTVGSRARGRGVRYRRA